MKFGANDTRYFRVGGRSLMRGGYRYLSYSGSYIEFTFRGIRAAVILKSSGYGNSPELLAQAAVIIDGDEENPVRFTLIPDAECRYCLFSSATPQTVTLRLVKMSEAKFAKMAVVGFEVECEEGGEPRPTLPKKRQIEFVGDSITCGYGNEGVLNRDLFRTSQENPLKAFAILTAGKLGADYELCCWSGIGVISGYVSPDVDTPSDTWLMPMIYPYTDAAVCNAMKLPRERWEIRDCGGRRPDIVVVNLGTNDSSYTRGIPERVERFRKQYYEFLTDIRKRNPESQIVCILGVMGTELCPVVRECVETFARNYSDDRIAFLEMDVQKPRDGTGTDFHPSLTTHRKMANVLAAYLEQFF